MPGAGIDGDYASGAVLEKAIGEAAGGCANIETDVVADTDLPVLQSVFQLDPAAANIFQIFAEQANLRSRIDRGSRLFDFLLVDQYFTGEYQGLGAFPGRNQTAIKQ